MSQRIVSAPLDEETLKRLDDFCSRAHRRRAEVLRGLLYALLIEGKQFIYEDLREQVK